MEMICAMTNIYCNSKLDLLNESNILKGNSRILSWKNISVCELYMYYGLVILMGLLKNLLIKCTGQMTPYCLPLCLERFHAISRYLHYSKDESIYKLRKIRPLFDVD